MKHISRDLTAPAVLRSFQEMVLRTMVGNREDEALRLEKQADGCDGKPHLVGIAADLRCRAARLRQL